ncbi:iron-containing alcohol dehydrogenase [Pseudobacteriovorax antillogorgiicola]|uniref:Uncharacterized protein n=1 Tax=Pseudobacteriovorax antillogorgiicola TaxID=1513793 RepID=A0A1Y6CMQ5_9BACT|nr:iron-containing alcohol dehydrogenase [Pseudobacteriovorax antillogorgiicola]TCS44605.1 hypothetical protein EDD56_13238 [Pseudobacteriovorax antillogorgiicola]SMF78218.1 hypothetical protein SAMN06296036_13238 [Pseudobacteriovorax antillogorgiicola]
MITQFNFPTTVRFGSGAIAELPASLLDRFQRPLIVTDRVIAKLPFLVDTCAQLKERGFSVEVYSDMGGNPVESDVTGGVDAFKKYQADCIVMIGGGATMDVGKAIALMANHPGALFDYEDGKPDARPSNEAFPFMVAVPTTAGTGSEVGRSSVISDNVSKAKKIIFSPKMLPDLVIADPALTLGLPPGVTAATGIDALTHLLEAYLAQGFHPMCDGIALEGIRLVSKSLSKAFHNPSDINARQDMLAASMMGAVAFQKGLGLNHSCAHALSTVFDTHHGLANAMMLEACMSFNQTAVPEKFETLAQVVSRASGDDFIQWLKELKDDLQIPAGLAKLDIQVNDRLLDVAEADICHPLGPRPVSRQDFKQLFEASM